MLCARSLSLSTSLAHTHNHTPHTILMCSKCTLVNVLIRHQLLWIEMGKRSCFSSHTCTDESLYLILAPLFLCQFLSLISLSSLRQKYLHALHSLTPSLFLFYLYTHFFYFISHIPTCVCVRVRVTARETEGYPDMRFHSLLLTSPPLCALWCGCVFVYKACLDSYCARLYACLHK